MAREGVVIEEEGRSIDLLNTSGGIGGVILGGVVVSGGVVCSEVVCGLVGAQIGSVSAPV